MLNEHQNKRVILPNLNIPPPPKKKTLSGSTASDL
jgi:hypothetical protein